VRNLLVVSGLLMVVLGFLGVMSLIITISDLAVYFCKGGLFPLVTIILTIVSIFLFGQAWVIHNVLLKKVINSVNITKIRKNISRKRAIISVFGRYHINVQDVFIVCEADYLYNGFSVRKRNIKTIGSFSIVDNLPFFFKQNLNITLGIQTFLKNPKFLVATVDRICKGEHTQIWFSGTTEFSEEGGFVFKSKISSFKDLVTYVKEGLNND
jgi:hypothetical protein